MSKSQAYDLVKEGEKYVLVKLEYDVETGEGKVVSKEEIGDNDSAALFKLNRIIVNKLFGIKE